MIFLAVAEVEGEGGKTSALKVEAKGEAEGLVFCTKSLIKKNYTHALKYSALK